VSSVVTQENRSKAERTDEVHIVCRDDVVTADVRVQAQAIRTAVEDHVVEINAAGPVVGDEETCCSCGIVRDDRSVCEIDRTAISWSVCLDYICVISTRACGFKVGVVDVEGTTAAYAECFS
jgi:hypothetical protein